MKNINVRAEIRIKIVTLEVSLEFLLYENTIYSKHFLIKKRRVINCVLFFKGQKTTILVLVYLNRSFG